MRLFLFGLVPLLFLFLGSNKAYTQHTAYIDLQTPVCKKVQNDLLNLRFASAQKELQIEEKKQPFNLGLVFWQHYAAYLSLQLNEDPAEYIVFKNKYKNSLTQLQRAGIHSPFLLWIQAEILVQNAVISLKFNELSHAAKNIREAYLLLQKNQKKYPNFIPNLKSMGWIEAMSSVVPDNYNWILSILGLKADMLGGIQKLETFCASDSKDIPLLIQMEGVFALSGLEFQLLKQSAVAVERMELTFAKRKDPLSLYLLSTIYYYTGYNEKLLHTSLQYSSQTNAQYLYLIDFYIGMGLLRKNQKNAHSFLQHFADNYPGHSYKAMASYGLALHYHLNGNREKAHLHIKNCQSNKQQYTEQDKQAYRESQRDLPSSLHLLRSRLFFDGNYLDSALQEVHKAEKTTHTSAIEKTELNYRKARIFHQKGELDKAIFYYQHCIETGRKLDRYFANYAALNLGLVFEERKQIDQSQSWYKEAIHGFPNNKEYRNSIQQKAKAGLNRIKKTEAENNK